MKKYVLGCTNLFDNDIKLNIIDAENEISAIKNYFAISDLPIHDLIKNMESVQEIKNFLIDCETLLEIIEVN